jgi:hypothetical protein
MPESMGLPSGPQICPHCGNSQDTIGTLDEMSVPLTGEPIICSDCFSLNTLDGNQKLRAMTDEEVKQLPRGMQMICKTVITNLKREQASNN